MKKELAITRILLNNIIRRVENKKNNHGYQNCSPTIRNESVPRLTYRSKNILYGTKPSRTLFIRGDTFSRNEELRIVHNNLVINRERCQDV